MAAAVTAGGDSVTAGTGTAGTGEGGGGGREGGAGGGARGRHSSALETSWRRSDAASWFASLSRRSARCSRRRFSFSSSSEEETSYNLQI
ncbi:hypothetical protein EYF80_055956 [Liparis tanakae]|uniref:Uncharacterized protein n=1 Tax=Liparis tanakae TaxID=230148 RepID=A0A4Z2EYN7_9TELE|nr:hypothetical protein EYF80_055956 [Liparis tanakae]